MAFLHRFRQVFINNIDYLTYFKLRNLNNSKKIIHLNLNLCKFLFFSPIQVNFYNLSNFQKMRILIKSIVFDSFKFFGRDNDEFEDKLQKFSKSLVHKFSKSQLFVVFFLHLCTLYNPQIIWFFDQIKIDYFCFQNYKSKNFKLCAILSEKIFLIVNFGLKSENHSIWRILALFRIFKKSCSPKTRIFKFQNFPFT